MSKQIEALKLALSALEEVRQETFRLMRDGQTLYAEDKVWSTIISIKEVLAQEQEPVAKKKHEPKIDLGKYAGTYGGYTTPEPSEGYLQKAYRLANELRSHLLIAPPQRTWVGLTQEEKHAIRYSHMTSAEFIEVIEAKLKDKNT